MTATQNNTEHVPHEYLCDILPRIGQAANTTDPEWDWTVAKDYTAQWGSRITGIHTNDLLKAANRNWETWAGGRPVNVLMADTLRALADMAEYRQGDDPDRTRITVLNALVSLIALENAND